MDLKKSLLLLVTVALLFSCKQEEVLDQNIDTTDLTADITQYDNSNLGLYKGTFTTLDAMERGTIEVKILDNVPSRATLTLSSGATYSLQSTSVVTSGQDTSLRFVAAAAESKDSVTFDLSVNADGTSMEITNTTLGSKDSHIIAAKETSRGPVVPLAGSFLCTDCGTTNWTSGQTFNLLFVTDPSGSGPGTLATVFTVNGAVFVSANNTQGACVTNGGFNDCEISGSTTITNDMTWTGTHTYDNTALNCSQVNGTWAYDSPTFGSLAGTFISDNVCGTPAVVGDLRAGGIVFWVDPADNRRGLVCALADAPTTFIWDAAIAYCEGYANPDTGTGVHYDWYLPSKDQLQLMYANLQRFGCSTNTPGGTDPSLCATRKGDFITSSYWSSTEYDNDIAWFQNFFSGNQDVNFKDDASLVRAVRAF